MIKTANIEYIKNTNKYAFHPVFKSVRLLPEHRQKLRYGFNFAGSFQQPRGKGNSMVDSSYVPRLSSSQIMLMEISERRMVGWAITAVVTRGESARLPPPRRIRSSPSLAPGQPFPLTGTYNSQSESGRVAFARWPAEGLHTSSLYFFRLQRQPNELSYRK